MVLDELGYLALPDGAAELVFQVITERNERGSLIVTTNLPFGEWTKVFPDPRLAKAVVDRITHRAHIIDTGTESWRFRHGLERRTRREADPHPDGAPATIATSPSPYALGSVTTVAATLPTASSGNIQTNNNRREVGPLQASTPGPLQVATTTVSSRVGSLHLPAPRGHLGIADSMPQRWRWSSRPARRLDAVFASAPVATGVCAASAASRA